MARSPLQKIGAKPGTRWVIVGTSAEQVAVLGLRPPVATRTLEGAYEYMHAFVTSTPELAVTFCRLKPHLAPKGMLWISWQKNAAEPGAGPNLRTIISLGYSAGLVESKTISLDAVWSAIKFTFPVRGKKYHNSYGRLRVLRQSRL